MQSADEHLENVLALCRSHPNDTRGRVRINSGKWQTMTGAQIIEAWDQPRVGTIEIDKVWLKVPGRRRSRVGEGSA